jgi:hypothetical protein
MMKPDKFYDKARLVRRLTVRTRIIDGHWLWIGKITSGGRGVMTVGGRLKGKDIEVHRLSAFIYLGLDLKDSNSHSLHKPSCTYRNCWNPEHLHVGSHADNMKDIMLLPNFRCGHPKEGNLSFRSNGHHRCLTCHRISVKNSRKRQLKTSVKTT